MRHSIYLRSVRYSAFVLFTGASLLLVGCSSKAPDNQGPVVVTSASAAEVKTGAVVQLDASKSTATAKGALTFTWTLKAPAGSKAAIANPKDAKTSFTADVAGVYSITVEVLDAKKNKATKTISVKAVAATKTKSTEISLDGDNGADPSASDTITFAWSFMEANVSDDKVAIGRAIMLDSPETDASENGAVTRTWTIVSKPANSAAKISDPAAANPTITLDEAGRYEFRVDVSDGVTTTSSSVEAEAVAVRAR